MGMLLSLYSLSDRHVNEVLDDPPLAWDILAADDPALRSALLRESGRSDTGERLDLAPDEVEEAELDKAWHGLHYLLTGSAWEGDEPLNFICLGGREVGELDTGYGPPRVLTAAEVGEIARALDAIDADELAQRFDPDAMQDLDIYPHIWDEGEEALDFLMASFGILKDFVAHTAKRGYGMMLCMR